MEREGGKKGEIDRWHRSSNAVGFSFFFCLTETTAGFSVAHGWCPFCLQQFCVIRRLRSVVATLQPVC